MVYKILAKFTKYYNITGIEYDALRCAQHWPSDIIGIPTTMLTCVIKFFSVMYERVLSTELFVGFT